MKVFFVDIGSMSKREAIKTGLKWLFETAIISGIKDCIIAIPVMNHIKDSHHDIHIALDEYLSGFAKKLAKQREFTVNGIQIKLVTEKTTSYLRKSLVLVIYPTKKYLVKLFDYGHIISQFFVVPWSMDEMTESLTIVQAINYSTNEIFGKGSDDLDPVIIEALRTLSIAVNIFTGIGKGAHPSDREKAKELFLILKKEKFILNAEQISTWLVTQGKWNPRHIEDVKELINNINNRKTLRVTYQKWKRDLINILKEQAKK